MASFNLAIPFVLKNEGDYVFDSVDPGGETKYGISKQSYPNLDIKNLTIEVATEIYHRDFWKFDGIIDQAVATKIFDAFVNMGHTAIRIAQRVVSAIPDGIYGPATESAINAFPPQDFLTGMRSGLVTHYNAIVAANPAEQKFLKGWLTRARL